MLNVPSDAVPPVSVRARRTASAASPAAASVRSASGRSSRPASVSSSRRPGAHEQRDAELGLEVADLLGDARAGEVQDVGRGGEGAVLGGGEEVGQLLQGHAVGTAYGKRSQSALARARRKADTGRHEPR